MKGAPTVVVIDDEEPVRHALAEMLSIFGYAVAVHATADRFLESVEPDQYICVVADVRLPGMDGIELVRELSRRKLAIPVVVITGHADVSMAVSAIKAGAEDLIEKPINDGQLIAAINRGFARGFELHQREESIRELRARLGRLTYREMQVFDLVVKGYSSRAISATLEISSRTVESYRVQIMEKMQAGSVAVLVRYAIRLGRLEP